MNDRCAAGTGRFFELLATRLSVRLASLGDLAGYSRNPAIISSMCVSLPRRRSSGFCIGNHRSDIAAGVQASLATRVAAMTGRNVASPIG